MYRLPEPAGMARILMFLAVFFSCRPAFAQSPATGSWETINLSYKPSERIFLYGELQARSQHLTDDFFYHEVKAGIGYTIPRKLSVMLAAGDYRTYGYPGNFKDLVTKEFRLWQQLSFKTPVEPVNLEHRYRIEQRWRNGNYRNRFRYRLNATVAINKKNIVANTFYVSVYDEVFFTNRAPYFERNRFFAGAGYQFSPLFALQSGILRQFDYRKSDDGSVKNFIQTSLLFFLDNEEEPSRHPSAMD